MLISAERYKKVVKMSLPHSPTKEEMQEIKRRVAEQGPIPLVAKANWLKKLMVCSNTIFQEEIMGLKKGDTAEVVGTWGPHDMYLDIKIHKYRYNITLLLLEVNILFDVRDNR